MRCQRRIWIYCGRRNVDIRRAGIGGVGPEIDTIMPIEVNLRGHAFSKPGEHTDTIPIQVKEALATHTHRERERERQKQNGRFAYTANAMPTP
jgi:hypothetical protein